MKKIALLLAVLMTLTCVLTGCGQNAGSAVDKIKEAGVLVIGTSADYEPYEYHAVIDGVDTIVGFDIEIAKKIAAELGVELKIEEMDFDGLLPALVAGKIDMVIAGMNPTDKRKESVDFSQIYYEAVQAVLVKADKQATYNTVESFNDAKIGVQKGTTQEEIATNQLTGGKIEALAKVPDLVLNLQMDKTNAVVLEAPVAQKYVEANPGELAIADFKFPQDADKGAACAFKKNSDDLVKLVDDCLSKMKTDGTINQLAADAFGG